MEKIEFRGKCVDDGEWVTGSYIYDDASERSFIVGDWLPQYGWDIHRVLPKTVGQFVGIADVDGVDIFVGDKIKLSNGNAVVESMRYFWESVGYRDAKKHPNCSDVNYTLHKMKIKVIGNIHDDAQ